MGQASVPVEIFPGFCRFQHNNVLPLAGGIYHGSDLLPGRSGKQPDETCKFFLRKLMQFISSSGMYI